MFILLRILLSNPMPSPLQSILALPVFRPEFIGMCTSSIRATCSSYLILDLTHYCISNAASIAQLA
jgi:hypothetical protein